MRLRRLLSEPLLHFLLLGSALFVVYRLMAPAPTSSNRIVVTKSAVDALVAQYQESVGRPPGVVELNAMVEAYVRDEILYREGVTVGLDRDDLVVKRRVRQKLEVMIEEELSAETPTDAELSAYLAANPAKFTQPAVLTFEQVFLGSQTSGPSMQRATAVTRAAVVRGTDPSTLGESTLLPAKMVRTPSDLVAREFGDDFATALDKLPVGDWAGPITSTFGAHLVRVTERMPAVAPRLADVRAKVQREFEYARRQRARDESYRKLRAQYEVVLEAKSPGGRP